MRMALDKNRSFQLNKKFGYGFTIIELVVVIAIVVIITGVVLLRQRDFDNTTLLKNTGYEFALSVKEAQSYGVSVRREVGNVGGRYGIHINLDSPKSTILYTDNSVENNSYDVGEERQVNEFEKSFSIKSICVVPMGGEEECSNVSDSSIKGLEILFVRPNPDAHLYVVRVGNVLESVSKARVTIGNARGKTIDVVITSIGQVSVL